MKKSTTFLGFLASTPWMGRLRAFARVGTYIAFAFLVLGLLALRSAVGHVSEQALVVGRQLTNLEEFTERSTRLSLNGQNMNIASKAVDLPVEAVLDRYAAMCQDGTLVADLAGVPDHGPAPSRWERLGILREMGDNEGFIACIAKRPGQEDRSLLEGLQKFAESQDLGDVGLVRYAYARRTRDGRTLVVTTWTDGSFLVSALMAADGDSPGTDPVDAPRPLKSRRFLTAQVEGEPDSVRVYESRASAAEVLDAYDAALPKQGWRRLDEVAEEAPMSRQYSRGGVDTLVVAAQNGDRAAVTVIQIQSE